MLFPTSCDSRFQGDTITSQFSNKASQLQFQKAPVFFSFAFSATSTTTRSKRIPDKFQYVFSFFSSYIFKDLSDSKERDGDSHGCSNTPSRGLFMHQQSPYRYYSTLPQHPAVVHFAKEAIPAFLPRKLAII